MADAVQSFDLTGRVALVSGASRGIGEAIAHTLAAHGAHVICASRKIEGCEAVAAAIRGAGHSAEAQACHIGDMDHIARMFAHVRNAHGKLDILVNNGATNPYFGPIEDTDLGAFQKTIDVNLRGYFFMSAEAVKLMKTHGGGSIVNTASVNAITPGVGQGIYSITKAGVVNMTKAFARECAPYNVRVNALLPGLTRTRLAGALLESGEDGQRFQIKIPMSRAAEPSEMAGAVLFLVSDSASYVTGVALNVDGGFLTT